MILWPSLLLVLTSSTNSWSLLSCLWTVAWSCSLLIVLELPGCCSLLLCFLLLRRVIHSYGTIAASVNWTLRYASLVLRCCFVWFSLVGAFDTLFIRLDSSLPSTIWVGRPNVTAALPLGKLYLTWKALHRPVRFSGHKSVRILCFCYSLLYLYIRYILTVALQFQFTTNC